ncbi:hypothetical protein ALC56_13142 [Trachymyrmex septentrionalis]|uniref:Uncharacterized protein n=1 Tax=Trachymyrmex septentrionalis TaxID=34720 RepID=A0A151JT89_9HYME|nr:hypothetical protein ALC56_13142 [Trachymyrmex septentrionalis]
MSNLRDLIEIRYENLVEGYLMIDNEPVDRMQLRNELGVQIISSVSSLEIDYFSNSIL